MIGLINLKIAIVLMASKTFRFLTVSITENDITKWGFLDDECLPVKGIIYEDVKIWEKVIIISFYQQN